MSNPYRLIIGLEVHVQLKTQSKLFCGCATTFGAPPNTQVCPVCLALPGALPVLNQHAIQLAAQAGMAMNSDIAPITRWDRKNYFYPDLPKGYQTSQLDLPVCNGGFIDLESSTPNTPPKRIRLVRAHLEEDAGKSLHDELGHHHDTRIDLNRAGTPLLEIVTQPDLQSTDETKAFLQQLKLLLTYVDVSDCNMQEGSLRVDANLNLEIDTPSGAVRTPITEIKNLNSFRAVERALQYEAQRQYEEWTQHHREFAPGNKQTRGWDDEAGRTLLQREKEESADYRYFPCPDLVPIEIAREQTDTWRSNLPELPADLLKRLPAQYSLSDYDANVLVSQGRSVVTYFESLIREGATPRRASSWMQQDVLRTLKEQEIEINDFPLTSTKLAALLIAIENGQLESSRGRDVFRDLLEHPQSSIEDSIQRLGIVQVDSSELEAICLSLLQQNPDVVAKIRAGNLKAIGSLVGAARKQNSNADPKRVQEICLRWIDQGAV